MNTLIAEIKNEIMEHFAKWEGDIDEFKFLYGNHINMLSYYDFEIEPNMVLPCIKYIMKCMVDFGLPKDQIIEGMKQTFGEVTEGTLVHTLYNLRGMVLYWVMEHIDFDHYANLQKN